MSNETPKTPAQLLAAVLRVVDPSRMYDATYTSAVTAWTLSSEGDGFHCSYCIESKDDLARVVAMLDGAQRERFKEAFADSFIERDPRCCVDLTMEMLLSDPSRHLAALVAATGVEA